MYATIVKTLKNKEAQEWSKAILLVSLLGLSNFSMAAGGLNVSSGSDLVKLIQEWTDLALSIAASMAVIFVLYKAIQAWSGKTDWMDVLQSCMWIAFAGGAKLISSTLWSIFS